MLDFIRIPLYNPLNHADDDLLRKQILDMSYTEWKKTGFCKDTLHYMKKNVENGGNTHLDIKSGDLHKTLGCYPGPHHRMPVCCNVMRQMMQEGDDILKQPPKGNGANLIIRYHLPRK